MTLLVFGFGFTALHGLDRFRERFPQVVGTVRTPGTAERLARIGVTPRRFGPDATDPALAADVAEATHLLLSIPPDPEGDPVLRRFRADLEGARRLRWIGYLSTIGVYGDHGGAWIDEAAPARASAWPPRRRGSISAGTPACRSSFSASPGSTARAATRS